MSQQVDFNGETHTLPTAGERGWGTAVTAFLVKVAENALTLATTLAAELDLGAVAGIRALWLRSKSNNPAASGVGRLANTDKWSWRNAANSADLPLGPGADNVLEFNSIDLVNVSSAQTISNKTFTPATPIALGAAGANWDGTGSTYWKDALGMVHVSATLTATGAGAANFYSAGSLPAGFRPGVTKVFCCLHWDDSTATRIAAFAYVNTDGSLTLFSSATPAVDDELIFTISFLPA